MSTPKTPYEARENWNGYRKAGYLRRIEDRREYESAVSLLLEAARAEYNLAKTAFHDQKLLMPVITALGDAIAAVEAQTAPQSTLEPS